MYSYRIMACIPNIELILKISWRVAQPQTRRRAVRCTRLAFSIHLHPTRYPRAAGTHTRTHQTGRSAAMANAEAGPSTPHEMRITNHGKITSWVTFALDHLQVCDRTRLRAFEYLNIVI